MARRRSDDHRTYRYPGPVDNPAHHVGDPVQMIYGTEQGR